MKALGVFFRKHWGTVAAVALILAVCLSALILTRVPLNHDHPDGGTADPGTKIVDTSKAEYTYEEMEEDLFLLARQYPELLRVASAGQSLDGREIYYADFGDINAPYQIMLNAGIHGREYLTPLLVMEQLEYYLWNYYGLEQNGQSFAERMGGIYFRVVPMINPDGITLSQKGLSGIRSQELKTDIIRIYNSDCEKYGYDQHYSSIESYLTAWKANARGVDLNRNFGIAYWESMHTGIILPSSQKYKGSAPNSEPETQALMNLTQSLTGLVCSVSIHSQGEILYWDCGQTGEVREETLALTNAIRDMNGYRLQSEFEHPDATYNDWCTLNLGVPSLNIETGTGSCPLPIGQFATIWSQNYRLWEVLVDYCHTSLDAKG